MLRRDAGCETVPAEAPSPLVPRPRRSVRGLTLVELLVVVGAVAILLALLMPAISSVRDASRRVHCGNNLRQLGMAAQHFDMANQMLPPYYGNFPRAGSPIIKDGSWILHLLPFLDNAEFYASVAAGPRGTTTFSSQVLVDAASDDYNPGGLVYSGGYWTSVPTTTIDAYGHVITLTDYVWVGPPPMTVPPSGRPPRYETRTTTIATVDPSAVAELNGVSLPVLRCPADPSDPPSRQGWQLTSYQANIHAFLPIKRSPYQRYGFEQPYTNNGISIDLGASFKLDDLSDGLSTVLLIGEGMGLCDGTYRYAWKNNWRVVPAGIGSHNFGIDWNFLPNPFMFQDNPSSAAVCDKFRVQGMHRAGLTVVMADASVRSINPNIDRRELTNPDVDNDAYSLGTIDKTWDLILQPRDGKAVALP